MTNNQESLIAKKGPIWTFNPFATPYIMQSTTMVSETHQIQCNADETPTKSDNSNMSLLPTPNTQAVASAPLSPLSPLENSLPSSFSGQNPPILGNNKKEDEEKIKERNIRNMLVPDNIVPFNKDTSIDLNKTPGENFYELANLNNNDDEFIRRLIDLFFVNFDQKMIFWGLGAERRYREAARTFIEFINDVKEDFSLLFDHKDESCNIISVLKMYIIENFYQTFHFEEANPYLAITRLEYNGLFQCIHCDENMFINTVHESYRDGCCPNCNSTYEEKFIKFFNSDKPYVKGGNINSAKFESLQRNHTKPTILAFLPTPKSSPEPVSQSVPTLDPVATSKPTVPEYKPYFFKPEDYKVTVNSEFTPELKTQVSTININESGINNYKDDKSSYEELNRKLYEIINMNNKYKKAVNTIMYRLKIVLLQVWKQTETLYNDKKKNDLYDLKVKEYITNAKDMWNLFPWKYYRNGKPFSIYLTLDGIVDVLYIKVNGRSIKQNSTNNRKRKAIEIENVVQSSKTDDKEESQKTNIPIRKGPNFKKFKKKDINKEKEEKEK